MAAPSPCASNSFIYNTSLYSCDPAVAYSGVEYSLSLSATIFAFDSIKRFTQSQAVFLEATLVMLLSWLAFCLFVRFGKLGDGRTIWFKICWCISRWDISFATRH